MNDNFLLHEEDMLMESHMPVIGFFSVISDTSRFIDIISHLANGCGYGYEFACCRFPNDLDDYAIAQGEMFDGVEFSLHSGEEIILSYAEFYWYLKTACSNYLRKYPSDLKTIQSILSKVSKQYNITNTTTSTPPPRC